MNWNEALKNLDRSEQNAAWADIETFQTELDLGHQYDGSTAFAERVKKYWVSSWVCTDTEVGLAAYFFDDELVAVSSQTARKSDEIIEFVSQAAVDKLRGFILSLAEHGTPAIADLDAEIEPWWFDNAKAVRRGRWPVPRP